MSNFHDCVSTQQITLIFFLQRLTQGQFGNNYGGFQQYTLATASSVAKVDHTIPLLFWGIAHTLVLLFRFLPTFRTMKLLLCLRPSQHRTSVCTIETLLDLDWFHLYLPRERESTLESPFLSSVDLVPSARMVS